MRKVEEMSEIRYLDKKDKPYILSSGQFSIFHEIECIDECSHHHCMTNQNDLE